MIMPFEGTYPITRPFIKLDPSMPKALWDPLHGPTHRGVDWALPVGVSLRATMNGQVTAAGFSPDGSGIIVVIRSGNLYVKYFHMSIVAVNVGQSVKTGDFLGKSGSSGNATGPHLHFQVEQPFGNAVDPMPLIEKPKEEAVYPNEEDVVAVLADRGVVASDAEKKKWANNPKFRWPEFWKDVKRNYPTPFATTPEFVKSMAQARGIQPSEDEIKKWSGILPSAFMQDLVKQYPLTTDARLERAKQLIKQAEEALL